MFKVHSEISIYKMQLYIYIFCNCSILYLYKLNNNYKIIPKKTLKNFQNHIEV